VTANYPLRHVCDYRDPDGTAGGEGACHLLGEHTGRCPDCDHATAPDCVHQAEWETILLCSTPSICEVHK
jgi:hypothetical protein